jgi:AAA+ ATPase superfamily predicted ATPase
VRFIDREEELEELERAQRLAAERLFTTLIFGQRRVGKTELVKQFEKGRRYLHFFVYEGKTKEAIREDFEKEMKEKGVLRPEVSIPSLDELLRFIFRECREYVVVFDEVQNMRNIYPAFFSVLQREIDENPDTPLHLILLGSVIGLVKVIFEDMKSPLYGRVKSIIRLRPFRYRQVRLFLKALGYRREEDFIRFYSVFGGLPKYYVAIDDYAMNGKDILEILEFFFFRENAPFREEVQGILRQEFGRGKSYFYSLLEAIATGHTRLSEISSFTKSAPTSITPFLSDLLEYYEIIEKVPRAGDEKGRKSVYLIKSPLFRFWFRYVYPNIGLLERGEHGRILEEVKRTFDSFIGLGFERVCVEVLEEMNRRDELPFKFESIGPYWGKLKRGGERAEFEIDAVALNGKTNEILFVECRWQDKVDAERVLRELREKSGFVEWRKGRRKEHYAIFARSFKEKVKEPGVMMVDLEDMKQVLDRSF